MDEQKPQSEPQATLTSTSSAVGTNTLMAVLAYLGLLIIVPFLVAKDDSYVKFHLKQGLLLIIGEAIVWFIMTVPFFGWFIGQILWLFIVILAIIGIVNAVTGKKRELPVIGKWASNFNF